MSGEEIVGLVIMAACCYGCGILFWSLSIHASRTEKPVSFWAGKEVASQWIDDIPGYNRENAIMWRLYSLPYFLSGVMACFCWLDDGFIIASMVVLLLAGFPGVWLLIHRYRKIERKYMNPKILDKADPFC